MAKKSQQNLELARPAASDGQIGAIEVSLTPELSVGDLSTQASRAIEKVTNLKAIATAEERKTAGEIFLEVKSVTKAIESLQNPITKRLREKAEEVRQFFGRFTNPLGQAEVSLTIKMRNWDDQEAKRLEEERRKNAEKARLAEEEFQKRAREAKAAEEAKKKADADAKAAAASFDEGAFEAAQATAEKAASDAEVSKLEAFNAGGHAVDLAFRPMPTETPKTQRTEAGTVTRRTSIRVELVDEALLPRDMLSYDAKKAHAWIKTQDQEALKAALRIGGQPIAGLRIYEEADYSGRLS